MKQPFPLPLVLSYSYNHDLFRARDLGGGPKLLGSARTSDLGGEGVYLANPIQS